MTLAWFTGHGVKLLDEPHLNIAAPKGTVIETIDVALLPAHGDDLLDVLHFAKISQTEGEFGCSQDWNGISGKRGSRSEP